MKCKFYSFWINYPCFSSVYNLFIIWNVNLELVVNSTSFPTVYNLFIIWNVNFETSTNTVLLFPVYNLFIIWNVNDEFEKIKNDRIKGL